MIGLKSAVGAAVLLAAVAGSAAAQETQTYAYDVHGRLVSVARTTATSGNTTTYVLDNADNRSARTTTASESLVAENSGVPAAFDVGAASKGLETSSSTRQGDAKPAASQDGSTGRNNSVGGR